MRFYVYNSQTTNLCMFNSSGQSKKLYKNSNQAPQQPMNIPPPRQQNSVSLFGGSSNSAQMNNPPPQNIFSFNSQLQNPQQPMNMPPPQQQNNANMNLFGSNSNNPFQNNAPQQNLFSNSFPSNNAPIFSGFQQQVGGGLQLLNNSKEDEQKKVVALIISFKNGGSYDHLFTSVQQQSQEGTKVLVYACSSNYIQNMIKALEGEPQDDTAQQMMGYMKELDSDCVVFNWQCCGGYAGSMFPEGAEHVMKFLKIILDRGHMAMFSDFSLKALIAQWKAEVLGPNPFKQVGGHTGMFQILFKNQHLQNCPSAQLQIIGQMAEQGRCNVVAAGGTIVYTVDSHVKSETYDLQILTVVPNIFGLNLPDNHVCKITDEIQGVAGHVLLTFKSGGHILTSMGHWIELMKIDTSEKKLFEVAEKQFGATKAAEMKMEYSNMNATQQKAYISNNAVNFVQNQAPCSNMAYKY